MKEKKNKIDYSIIVLFSIKEIGHSVALKKLKATIKKRLAIHPIDSGRIEGGIGVDYKSEDEAIKMANSIKKKFKFVNRIELHEYTNGNSTKTIKI